MGDIPLNRSETRKEVEDREYLAQLLRTQTMLAAQSNLNPGSARRIKERSTTPPGKLYIPKTQYVPSRPPTLPSMPSPYTTSSTVSLEIQSCEEVGSGVHPTPSTLPSTIEEEPFEPEPSSLPLIIHPPSPHSPTSTSSIPFLPIFEQQRQPSPEPRPVSPLVATYLRQQEDQPQGETSAMPSQGSVNDLNPMAEDKEPQHEQSQRDRRSRSPPLYSPATPRSARAQSPHSPQSPVHHNSNTASTSFFPPAEIWTEQEARRERLERQTRQELMLKRSSLLKPVHRTSVPPASSSHERHISLPSTLAASPLLGLEGENQQQQRQQLLQPSTKPLDRAWSQKWTFSLQQQQWQDQQRQQHRQSMPSTLPSRSKRVSFKNRVFRHSDSNGSGIAADASVEGQRKLSALFIPQRQDQSQDLPQRPALASTRNSLLASTSRERRDAMSSDNWTLDGSESTLTELWSTGHLQGDGQSDGMKDIKKGAKNEARKLNPSGPIPLGLVALLICIFMLAYNVVLGIFVFQASGYHFFFSASPSASVPVALFTLFFLTSAVVAIFGFLAWALTNLKATRNSRSTSILFRIFHLFFLFVSLLTTGSMFYWLQLNRDQTGRWDHIRLPPFSEEIDAESLESPLVQNAPPLLSFQSLLEPAGPPFPSDEWLIQPWIWISVFAVVLIAQIYSWVCLVAYVRKVDTRARCEKKIQDRDQRFDYEVKRRV